MSQRAIVSSVEAIEVFRSNLLVYLSKARPTLEEVSADVMRTRLWIENEQRTHWESELRRRTKELEAAQQALFSSRLGSLSKETAAEQMAVHRAKRAADQAQDKLRVLKRWSREFDGRVQPLVKQMEKLHTVLSNDMIKAAAYLAEVIKTLAAYADATPPPSVTSETGQRNPSAGAAAGSEPSAPVEKTIEN